MSSVPSIQPLVQPVQPLVQYGVMPAPAAAVPVEEKNFIEGVMWGLNGIQNAVAGVVTAGSIIMLDTAALAATSQSKPSEAIAGSDGSEAIAGLVLLTALHVLAFYVAKAEFAIAGKSFTHAKNTIL